jgi:hypothetical protein
MRHSKKVKMGILGMMRTMLSAQRVLTTRPMAPVSQFYKQVLLRTDPPYRTRLFHGHARHDSSRYDLSFSEPRYRLMMDTSHNILSQPDAEIVVLTRLSTLHAYAGLNNEHYEWPVVTLVHPQSRPCRSKRQKYAAGWILFRNARTVVHASGKVSVLRVTQDILDTRTSRCDRR